MDFNTFRVKRDTSLNVGTARKLRKITYVEYVERYIDQEDETDASKGGVPEYVFRSQDGYFGIVPMPDKAYSVEYSTLCTP